jgi:Na+/melibiose symporter-like transporter
MMIVGLSTFGPLLFQSVLGHSPTVSGELLVPFTLAWMFGSIVSTRMLERYSYRSLLLLGSGMTLVGFLAFMLLFYRLNIPIIAITTFIMGWGMAFNYPIAIITTQYSVPKDQIGFATSGISWVRNMGMTIGTTVMGVVLILAFQDNVMNLLPGASSKILRALRDHPEILSASSADGLVPAGVDLKVILHQSLFWVFAVKFAAVALSFGLTFLFPKIIPSDPKQLEYQSSQL